jgi:putative Mg2+ transporter-C (MgtC) family protein
VYAVSDILLVTVENLRFAGIAFFRIFVAVALGSIVGYEREHTNRPAGMRTHVLVCVGAAVVMITSQYIQDVLYPDSNIDVTRLGAQVISGIGFLGVGTIINEGIIVRGLTTAASLWVISCVGLAVGIGFYGGAILATVMIFIILEFLRKLVHIRTKSRTVYISMTSLDTALPGINREFARFSVAILNSEISVKQIDEAKMIRIQVGLPSDIRLFDAAIDKVREKDDVISVHVD